MPLSFDLFWSRVSSGLLIRPTDIGPVTATTDLFQDLQLDSLQGFQLLMIIESLAGLQVPPVDLPPLMFSAGDAYQYYLLLCASD